MSEYLSKEELLELDDLSMFLYLHTHYKDIRSPYWRDGFGDDKDIINKLKRFVDTSEGQDLKRLLRWDFPSTRMG